MSTPETIPDRASNAGPEPEPAKDWLDWMYDADEYGKMARHSIRGPERVRYIKRAIEAMQEAQELL